MRNSACCDMTLVTVDAIISTNETQKKLSDWAEKGQNDGTLCNHTHGSSKCDVLKFNIRAHNHFKF